jgi:hypothetical protein
MPFSFKVCTNGFPLASDWKRVSSYKIAPEMYFPSPGAEKRSPLRESFDVGIAIDATSS